MSTKTAAAFVDVRVSTEMDFVSFMYLSVKNNTCGLPVIVLGNGPYTSMATSLMGWRLGTVTKVCDDVI